MPELRATTGLQAWLDLLRVLYPVTAVAHVGAGNGIAGAPYAHWEVARALLIDAQDEVGSGLAALVRDRPGWHAATALVADREEDLEFFVASNPRESGRIAPDRQTHLWRNLAARERRMLRSARLDTLLASPQHEGAAFNWLIVDCLPALPVLRGGGTLNARWDVVVVRALVDDAALDGSGATKAEVDDFLAAQGLRCVAWEEERQPAIAQVLYVRDWKASSEALARDYDNRSLMQAMAAAQVQGRIDQAAHANAELTRRAAALQSRIVALEEALQAAAVEREARDQAARSGSERERQLEEQIAALAGERDAQARAGAERQARIDQLTRDHDEHARVSRERLAHIEQLLREQEASARRAADIERDRGELEFRQRRMDEELAKAEAQIELITNVVLREKAF